MTTLSNVNIGGVKDQVRINALQSFEFFANSVLSVGVSEATCVLVQECVEDHEDAIFHTRCPRALAIAIYAWLASHGVQVVTSARLPEHEVLHWLDLLGGQDVGKGSNDLPGEQEGSVILDVLHDAVHIRWV